MNRQELIEKLGTMPDTKLAKQYGISRERVRQLRVKHNIAPHVKPEPEWVKVLGTMSDYDVAKKYNVNAGKVFYTRQKFGIKPFDTSSTWTDEMISDLGKLTDPKFAEKHGVTTTIAYNKRKELGIPANENVRNRWNPKVEWTEELENLLGVVSDTELAKRLGVSAVTVFQRRKKLHETNKHVTHIP